MRERGVRERDREREREREKERDRKRETDRERERDREIDSSTLIPKPSTLNAYGKLGCDKVKVDPRLEK